MQSPPDKDSTTRPPSEAAGHFGIFGGRYVGETLMPALLELDAARREAMADPAFLADLRARLRDYVGRPTPLYLAERLTAEAGGVAIHLKREDLAHTGAHKINNTLGQALLARRMGKRRVIAETGAGQHGVATATVAALFGLECRVFMGVEDIDRQAPNVERMKLLGAEVVPVASGDGTLKDAMNEALRYWTEAVRDTLYIIGSVAGPHPYPTMVRDFQRVIGDEARAQFLDATGGLPSVCVACVGGGSNAMGLFAAFVDDPGVELLGVEAGGLGLATGRHAATINAGSEGVLHGAKSLLLQDEAGQVVATHSISAGLDYPGVGPEHAHLHRTGRARYTVATDAEALEAFHLLARLEGILPALESAHALAAALREAARRPAAERVLVCLSGRGDKDLAHILRLGAAASADAACDGMAGGTSQ